MTFAQRTDHLRPEGAYAVLAKAEALEAQGREIIHLEIGQPDFETPSHVALAGIRAITTGKTGYNPPAGIDELRHALERDEFMLLYQPQVDILQDRIVGIEALIRWQHPERGMIPPDQFIGIAEETGLIVPIGEWVLQHACDQMRLMRDSGLPAIHVSVNLSVRQLREASLVDKVGQALRLSGLEASMLDLEITESMLMSNMDRVNRTLRELSNLGVSISVDDFGTGHSSLAYLKQFPISTLKVDRSFIRDIPHDKDDTAITIAIINLAKGLGIRTVAEGVESRDQLDFLKQQSCNLMQGYYFSKPVPYEEIVSLLQQEQADSKPTRFDSAI